MTEDNLVARLREEARYMEEETVQYDLTMPPLLREAADALELTQEWLGKFQEEAAINLLRAEIAERNGKLLAERNVEHFNRATAEYNRAEAAEARAEEAEQQVLRWQNEYAKAQNPDSAERIERVRRVIALTESRNNAPAVCADHPFLVEDLKWLTDRTTGGHE